VNKPTHSIEVRTRLPSSSILDHLSLQSRDKAGRLRPTDGLGVEGAHQALPSADRYR